MHRLNSSCRSVPPEETLARARRMGDRLGVTRVTDTTRLDRIGIPVYAGIRPTAHDLSLCVNAGKGVRPIEARVGAYMEAIEYAVAESAHEYKAIYTADTRALLGRGSRSAVIDLCPIYGAEFDLRLPIDCVDADELMTGTSVPVPAELVFFPYAHGGRAIFGSTTNGLASGNTVEEATLHALLEVVERDITAHHTIKRRIQRVDIASLPAVPSELVEKIHAAGCTITISYLPSALGIPLFESYVYDPTGAAGVPMAGGYGCHAEPEIALIRAITEACQSRLTMIHGGRDDLVTAEAERERRSAGDIERWAERRVYDLTTHPVVVRYDDIDAPVRGRRSIADIIQGVVERLAESGFNQVCRFVLGAPDDELQVVRVIVPRMEFFGGSVRRIGPRLLREMHAATA